MRATPKLLLVAVTAFGLVAASCGSGSGGTATTATTAAASATTAPGTPAAVSGTVTVLAASSLTESFGEIASAFSAAHPGAKVNLSFGASSELVTQIVNGAPADVFASADQANMKKVTDAGEAAGAPTVFATNSLEIIVGAGNPKRIRSVADLAEPDLIVVDCDPAVPIGKYAAQVLANAGVTVTPKSLEQNVKGIVTKVTTGEADAGIVYRTDVIAAGAKAAGVEIPADINVVAEYPLVVTKSSTNAAAASAFIELVRSDQGEQILARHGFTAP